MFDCIIDFTILFGLKLQTLLFAKELDHQPEENKRPGAPCLMKSFAVWTRPTGYVHTASFSDLQDGASSGCWEIYDPSTEPLILSLQSASLSPSNKKQLPVSPPVRTK